MITSLESVLQHALHNKTAVAGFVGLGWEDMRAYVKAAELENKPVIIQAGPGCRAHTPIEVLGPMMCHLADSVNVPVVVHLDHSKSIDECSRAIDMGFSSVMFDGSDLPIEENIRLTRSVVELAIARCVSVEGEVGYVGYAKGEASQGSEPDEVGLFAESTGVDAVAISIGNVHLQTEKEAVINFELLAEIEAKCSLPLVLHGGSGISPVIRQRLARHSNVCKFNIGTELRQAFGNHLRDVLKANPSQFDRIALLSEVENLLISDVRTLLRDM